MNITHQHQVTGQSHDRLDRPSGFRTLATFMARRSSLFAVGLAATVATLATAPRASADSWGLRDVMKTGAGLNYGNYYELRSNRTNTSVAAISTTTFTTIKNKGFKFVRIPVTWGYRYDWATKTINSTFMTSVKTSVSNALSVGLIVILDTHHEEWFEYYWAGKGDAKIIANPAGSDPYDNGSGTTTVKGEYYASDSGLNAWTIYKDIYTEIVTAFKNYSSDLILEGLNEPEVGTSTSEADHSWFSNTEVNNLNQALFNIVCSISVQPRTFMLSCNDEDGIDYLQYLTMPTYSSWSEDVRRGRLMLTAHFYNPWAFVSGSDPTWGSTSDYSSMASQFATISTQKNRLNIPMVIGEFGVAWGNNQTASNVLLWTKEFGRLAKAASFPSCAWDDSGNFGIMDHSSNTFATSGQRYDYTQSILTSLD